MSKTLNWAEFLSDKEWYDNSLVSKILACERKAYYIKHLAGGLKMTVGSGADFGTCLHAGTAAYYAKWGKLDEPARRRHAYRVFSETYGRVFPTPVPLELEPKHSLSNGLVVLDNYFSSHLATDSSLKPIEVEMGGAVKIKPRPGEIDFKPFWYVFRVDGLHQRMSYGDYFVRELKSTSSGAERRLKSLKIDRQSLGYLYCLRQFPGFEVSGIIGDVVLVATRTFDARRDIFIKPQRATDDWRAQTIHIVNHWRALSWSSANRELHDILNIYTQNTEECLSYGMCPFYDLCEFGVSATTLAPFLKNDWNPLADYDINADPERSLEKVTDSAVKESTIVN